MSAINIYDAKAQLSKLVARAEAGEEITLARNGRPVARLVPLGRRTAPRVPGALKGQIVIHDDFDELDDETLRDWYGE
jgi:prevent-host-death family protein